MEATNRVVDCVFCLRKEKEIPKERVTKEERWWNPPAPLAPPRVARPKTTVTKGRTSTHKPKRRGRRVTKSAQKEESHQKCPEVV